jgi:hypothetical protein
MDASYFNERAAAREELRKQLNLPEAGGVGQLYANVGRALESLIERIATDQRQITIPAMAENEPWLILFSRSSGWQFEWVEMPGVTEEGWYLATLTPPTEEVIDGEVQG